ncbi:MAG TPA: TIGR03067 domain-containing protein [Desulfomonilaceae bacterium]|nr:TIGR03067 domain-containing protein [Desulfomonilaceae bacterium]
MRWKIASIGAAFLLLWSVGFALAADVGGADAQKELQKLQGTWIMVSGELGGKKAADEHVSRSKIIYEGNKGQVIVPNQTEEPIIFEIVKIDATKNPKEMHLVRKNGPNAGKTLIGIYEFEGDDQYKFAFDPTGAVTLKEFTTKEGTGHVRNTWKRVKP